LLKRLELVCPFTQQTNSKRFGKQQTHSKRFGKQKTNFKRQYGNFFKDEKSLFN
jgi:hypothetical protein